MGGSDAAPTSIPDIAGAILRTRFTGLHALTSFAICIQNYRFSPVIQALSSPSRSLSCSVLGATTFTLHLRPIFALRKALFGLVAKCTAPNRTVSPF